VFEIVKSLPFARLKDYLDVSFSHLTPKKLINILKTEVNLLARKKVVDSFPYFLVVDPTNICQLQCPLCSTGQRQNLRPQGKMGLSTFKKIIDELGDYLLEVHLIWWGEPFLNKDILEFVKYAHRKNIGTFISTNFSFPFKPEQIKDIVKSGLDILSVSLDGITPEIYHHYRVGGNFSWVINNLKMIKKAKKNLNQRHPSIQWQFLVTKYNEHQIPLLKDWTKKLGIDSLVFEQLLVLFGQSKHNQIEITDWLPQSKQFRPTISSLATNKSDNLKPGKCWWLWRSLAISHDGGVSPCCYNNDADNDFGNINKNSFKEIWNNEKYQAARSLFGKHKSKLPTLCNQCEIAKFKKSQCSNVQNKSKSKI